MSASTVTQIDLPAHETLVNNALRETMAERQVNDSSARATPTTAQNAITKAKTRAARIPANPVTGVADAPSPLWASSCARWRAS